MVDAIFSFNTLWWVLMILFIPSSLALIIMVLLQQGKGSGFGGAFGAGAGPGADTVFGPKGAQSVPVKITYALASIFMLISILMSLIAGRLSSSDAPELIQGAGDAPAVSATSSILSERGLGTGIINEDPEEGTVIQETTVQSTPGAEEEAAESQDGETSNAEN